MTCSSRYHSHSSFLQPRALHLGHGSVLCPTWTPCIMLDLAHLSPHFPRISFDEDLSTKYMTFIINKHHPTSHLIEWNGISSVPNLERTPQSADRAGLTRRIELIHDLLPAATLRNMPFHQVLLRTSTRHEKPRSASFAYSYYVSSRLSRRLNDSARQASKDIPRASKSSCIRKKYQKSRISQESVSRQQH